MAWTDDLSRIQFQATDTHIQWRYIGTATWNNLLAFSAPLPVSGPLTNNELRAFPLPVSGPLTDDELRAIPVPVVASAAARIPTTTSVASSATSVTILASNASRRGVAINNQSVARLYLSFSDPATVANSFIELGAGAFILLDQQLIVSGAIYGIWSSANGTAQVTEFV